MTNEIKDRVYDFFVQSSDFNGIPIRQISEEFEIDYVNSIDLIKELVVHDLISIQSSTNPHIIGFQHYPVDSQLKILEEAKKNTSEIRQFGDISISFENTEYPICLYPSVNYLERNRDINSLPEYKKQLALGSPQLMPIFFDIEVLERYVTDPRFDFKFEDYSGEISCKYDENENPIVREEDQVFLKTFGLGFDEDNNRLAVVYLRYLSDLTPEHQTYWKNKEAKGKCKILAEYHENTIQGNWSFSHSIFSGFIGELNCLNELSMLVFNTPIFKKSFDKDKRPKEFTFFFTPTSKNYDDFVLLLDKMISDNINAKFFENKIEPFDLVEIEQGVVERKRKGTLRLFEEWLLSVYNIDDKDVIADIFRPLKKVRRERQNPAHRISENIFDRKFISKQKELISASYSSIRDLRRIFGQHPKAKSYEIPEWLDNGEIKNF